MLNTIMQNQLIISIAGGTCSGKTFLAELLCKTCEFDRIVTATTRPPRHGEVHGATYNFVGHALFDELDKRGQLLEKTKVGSHSYGIQLGEVMRIIDAGKTPVAVVDPAGVNNITAYLMREKTKGRLTNLHHWSIFLDVPLEMRLERFLTRFKEDEKGDPQVYTNRLLHVVYEEDRWRDMAPYCVRYDFGDAKTAQRIVNNLKALRHEIMAVNQPASEFSPTV